MQIIIKQNYNHYNRTLGMQINSKAHYERVCKERGMVSLEEAHELAASKKPKDYKISKDTEDLIRHAHQIKDKKGNLKLGDVAIDKLIEKKAIGRVIPDYMKLPSAYEKKGGFS